MGRWIAGFAGAPGAVLASSAVRTSETARLVMEAAEADPARIRTLSALYAATPETVFQLIRETPGPPASPLLVVGHNPATEALAGRLSGAFEPFPTAAVAVFEAEVEAWRDLDPGAVARVAFMRPRELPGEFVDDVGGRAPKAGTG